MSAGPVTRTGLLTGGGLLLAVVLFFAVNIVANTLLTSSRVDLTQNRLYTLSEGTLNILGRLEEPVTLRLFLTRDVAALLPGISSYANRVRELLEEYERHANGMLDVRLVDPEPFSEDEDRAVGYGLSGVPLGDGDTVLYFGLVGTGSTDEEEVIPFFSVEREEFLEYDLTKLVHQLSQPKLQVVGVMSSLPLDGFGGGMPALAAPMAQPWVVLEQMRQLFEIRMLQPQDTTIPEEVDVLMLVHPKELGEQTLYAIDQFVLRGGRALVFVDPYAESDPAGATGVVAASDLNRLLRQWGLELVTGKVVADLPVATRIRTARDGRNVVLEYPVWMNVQPPQMDATDVVTSRLGNLLLATAGHLRTVDGAETTIVPLIRSTPEAAEVDTIALGFDADPREILRGYRPGGTALTLAARITGAVKSLFPDGAPAPEGGDAAAEPAPAAGAGAQEHLSASSDPVNVIVVADADLLQDRFWVQVQNLLGTSIAVPSAANGSFVVNALDNLSGSNDLISVRNRGSFARPFTLVQSIQLDAELRFRQKENELLAELQQTEERLRELDRQNPGDALVLSAEQREELARFRAEKVRLRTELRDVRHALHRDIERLESWTKFINIALMPLLIGVGGAVVGFTSVRRRRGGTSAQPGRA